MVPAETEGRQRRPPSRGVLVGIGTQLDQLEIVVAEVPEALLDDLQSSCIVESLEEAGRLFGYKAEAIDQREIERIGDVLGSGDFTPGSIYLHENKTAGVEDLHRETPADLEDAWV